MRPVRENCLKFFVLFIGYCILLIAMGVKDLFGKFDLLIDNTYFHFLNVLIAIGYILLLFNWWPSAREVITVFIMFSSVICFLLAISTGIGGIFLNHYTEGWLEVRLNNAMNNYGNNTETTKAFDLVQTEMKCCGVYNHSDWQGFGFSSSANGHRGLPITCCDLPMATFSEFYCNITSASLHKAGCLDEFGTYVLGKNLYILYGGFGISIFLTFVILATLYLMKASPAAGYEEM